MLEAYRTPHRVVMPDKRGLHELYVRFFRMAERRIAEKTGRGVVSFISNYSWLDGRSFAAMRERFMEVFDAVRIDNLHGDRIISEYAPDGRTSETIFAVKVKSPGIKVGTSIALLSKSGTDIDAPTTGGVWYRDFHQAKAAERRRALLDSLEVDVIDDGYSTLEPNLRLGLPFKPTPVSPDWFDWPALPDLFPVQFSGVNTNRDGFVVDISLSDLESRIDDYFDASFSHAELAKRHPVAMEPRARYDPVSVRDALLSRGAPHSAGFLRYAYRPSTRGGCTGSPKPSFSTRSAPTTDRTFSPATYGCPPHRTCVRMLANLRRASHGIWLACISSSVVRTCFPPIGSTRAWHCLEGREVMVRLGSRT